MKLAVGPIELTVIATPGHTPCGLCFAGRIGGKLVLLTGDTAIGDQGATRGVVGWLDGHWGSNPRHLLASLRRLTALDADVLAPGHGRPILGSAAVASSLAHCIERVRQLLAIGDLHTMMPLDLSD